MHWHKHFMSIAINEIDKGIFDENKLLTDLQKNFKIGEGNTTTC